MQVTAFLVFFAVGLLAFFLSTRKNENDLSNTFQVQVSAINLIVWVAIAFSSFNIEFLVYDGETVSYISKVEYGYVGIALFMLFLSMLNLFILFTVGSWNTFLKVKQPKLRRN